MICVDTENDLLNNAVDYGDGIPVIENKCEKESFRYLKSYPELLVMVRKQKPGNEHKLPPEDSLNDLCNYCMDRMDPWIGGAGFSAFQDDVKLYDMLVDWLTKFASKEERLMVDISDYLSLEWSLNLLRFCLGEYVRRETRRRSGAKAFRTEDTLYSRGIMKLVKAAKAFTKHQYN